MLDAYINKKYLSKSSIKSLKLKFIHAKPFPYLVLSNFFNESFVNKLFIHLRKDISLSYTFIISLI